MRRAAPGAVLLTLVLGACTEPPNPPAASESSDSAPAATTSPNDSAPPVARAGFLAGRTDDPAPLTGEWLARAGECPDPPSLQLLAEGDSVGVLIVLTYPDSGSRETRYPVESPDSGPPAPGTARFGIQRIQYLALGFRAVAGTVDLSRLDRRATGAFAVRLLEAITQREVRYAGSFRGVRVEPWPADLCVMVAAPDSAAADVVR
ncbi:MAG: hypothetical protein HY337_03610 [Gemmatimonadetes bacterium]|nr:hypothetical protein [Gemmatimonadota bacterium]